jgi:hypothetical protein
MNIFTYRPLVSSIQLTSAFFIFSFFIFSFSFSHFFHLFLPSLSATFDSLLIKEFTLMIHEAMTTSLNLLKFNNWVYFVNFLDLLKMIRIRKMLYFVFSRMEYNYGAFNMHRLNRCLFGYLNKKIRIDKM